MKNAIPFIIFVAALIAIDLYAFKSLRLVISGWDRPWRYASYGGYLFTSIATYALIAYAFARFSRDATKHMDYYIFFMGFGILMLFIIPKLVVAIFHLADDLTHLSKILVTRVIRETSSDHIRGTSLTRWQFISRIGWLAASIPFLGISYGILRGRYSFRVVKESIASKRLPAALDGLRIVHISDIHIGSFFDNYDAVARGIAMVNELEPDLIFFTGDLVNNYADEVAGWEETLSALKAKYGKYSIFGNHDYGDYVSWPSETAKRENLEKLAAYHKKLGFKLLLDEWLPVDAGREVPLQLIGVQNWGQGGFAKYGDLNQAMAGIDPKAFQVLLSHDPSHWDAQVMGKTPIDLTLSGHTHGMQFGVEIPGIIKWSPVKYRYPRWGGHYREGEQHLYVNRGFGYIGFPGRVGMPPEITLIELKKA